MIERVILDDTVRDHLHRMRVEYEFDCIEIDFHRDENLFPHVEDRRVNIHD